MKYKKNEKKKNPQSFILEYVLQAPTADNGGGTGTLSCSIHYQCLLTDLKVSGVNSCDANWNHCHEFAAGKGAGAAAVMAGLRPSLSPQKAKRLETPTSTGSGLVWGGWWELLSVQGKPLPQETMSPPTWPKHLQGSFGEALASALPHSSLRVPPGVSRVSHSEFIGPFDKAIISFAVMG